MKCGKCGYEDKPGESTIEPGGVDLSSRAGGVRIDTIIHCEQLALCGICERDLQDELEPIIEKYLNKAR